MASMGKANRTLSEARAPEPGQPGLCHDAHVLSISPLAFGISSDCNRGNLW